MLRLLTDVRLLADDGSLQPGWIQIDGEQIVATGFGDALPPIGSDGETQSGAIVWILVAPRSTPTMMLMSGAFRADTRGPDQYSSAA